MTRWLADTLFKRLFALMLLTLVASHLAAFLVVTQGFTGPPGPMPGEFAGPPPGPQRADGPHLAGPPRAGQRPLPELAPGPWGGPQSARWRLLDYGLQLLIIAAAAGWGAHWLALPMRRLTDAAGALHRALAGQQPVSRLDELSGTVEVRETAHVFNEMARELGELVQSRALLVAAISHDLRTPLTRIRMRLENNENDPLAVRSIADIHEMDDLIESALEVFRGFGHEEAAQVTDVLALVQSVTDDLADLGQPVSVLGLPALARVQPAALRRAVSNLVANALRYGERADLQVSVHGPQVEILVDDAGPGIPPAQIEAVMSPFFRLETSRNRRTGGSGLGLYIARDLVTRQGGTLRLANRPEGGLRATISLPRV